MEYKLNTSPVHKHNGVYTECSKKAAYEATCIRRGTHVSERHPFPPSEGDLLACKATYWPARGRERVEIDASTVPGYHRKIPHAPAKAATIEVDTKDPSNDWAGVCATCVSHGCEAR